MKKVYHIKKITHQVIKLTFLVHKIIVLAVRTIKLNGLRLTAYGNGVGGAKNTPPLPSIPALPPRLPLFKPTLRLVLNLLGKPTVFFQPIRSQTKTNCDVAHAGFPALGTSCTFSRACHKLQYHGLPNGPFYGQQFRST